MEKSRVEGLLDFIKKSPTAFGAVETISVTLRAHGFVCLDEADEWKPERGGKYFVTRNMSSVIAFAMPDGNIESMMLAASHTDSPTFKVKTVPESGAFGRYRRLCVEPYGGMIMPSWFDRPLSVAGRVTVCRDGRFTSVPVSVDRDLCLIPNVAIHMNRTVNDGYKYNPATDLMPLFSQADGDRLTGIVADAAGVNESDIAGMDLYLYNCTPGCIFGADNEFFASPRIDNLMCAYSALEGFLGSAGCGALRAYACFDNEETGSATGQGAGSAFLRDTLERICEADGTDLRRVLASSFMVSADNGHARHPNHPELCDPDNCPHMNGGVVIKTNAAQRYASDGVSSAIFKEICRRAGVPVQIYANRSDMPGGSTLGTISDTKVPLVTVDIGMAQLAMHSAYETAGCADVGYLCDAMREFYSRRISSVRDGEYILI